MSLSEPEKYQMANPRELAYTSNSLITLSIHAVLLSFTPGADYEYPPVLCMGQTTTKLVNFYTHS
jgi:hypothetical protein